MGLLKTLSILASGHGGYRTLGSNRSVSSGQNNEARAKLILRHTVMSRDHLTPEIGLRLITPECVLWRAREEESPFKDPFWAIYWPGGQVLTRFILDNPDLFRGDALLDVGSGCGAAAIAAARVGASSVIANDVDPNAISAIMLNAAMNNVNVVVESGNLIGQVNNKWKTIVLGDMFYDAAFRDVIIDWLTMQCREFKSNVFIGDPGRLPLIEHPIKSHLRKVGQYVLPKRCREENNGMTEGFVWQLNV